MPTGCTDGQGVLCSINAAGCAKDSMLPQQPVSGCESRLHNTSCEEEGVYRVARYSSAVALLLRWRNFRIFRVGLAAGGHVRLAATFFAAGEPEDLETGSSAWWAQGAKEDWAGARSPELVVLSLIHI